MLSHKKYLANKNRRAHTVRTRFEPLERRNLLSGVPVGDGVPVLSSNPSATAKLYLDFDGDSGGAWNSFNVSAVPAYGTDSDPTTFSATELTNIQRIWTRVAEKFAPFNIDVTTVNPGTF